jgi:peptidoglycan-associated lipoprotein
LLPDEDGKTGVVVVRSRTATVELSEPYSYVAVADDTTVPAVQAADPVTVDKETGPLINAEPERTLHFILYFDHDSTQLTAQSRQLIPEILQALKTRQHAEINIIGHTDTKGSAQHNIELSLKRAQTVERILREYDKNLQHFYVQAFGEKDLLVPTEDEISEERNRRVEIMIR